MPNWCSCDLAIKGRDWPLVMERVRTRETAFDFQRIIPYPWHYRRQDEAVHRLREELDGLSNDERIAKLEELGGWPKDGYNSGGYDWCIGNWGVKWPVADLCVESKSVTRIKLTFDTPWGPPLPVIARLSEFPTHSVEFDLRYYEAGMAFQGRFVARAGEEIENTSWDYRGG